MRHADDFEDLGIIIAGGAHGGEAERGPGGQWPEPWPIHLVYVAQGPLPLKVRAFLDRAAPRLRDRLQA